MHITARDMAKFGLLYLNEGQYGGNQVIPADWVEDSFQRYTRGHECQWVDTRCHKPLRRIR